MIVYKLFQIKQGKLFPLYVEANREIEIGKWLKAGCGQLVDDTHVKASGCGGTLRLRQGYHSTEVPFTDWIGKRTESGVLVQRNDTVWCECEVRGTKIECTEHNGFKYIPKNSWYYFKTNSKQDKPWIISDQLKVNRILSNDEVAKICRANGYEPQPIEASA